MTRHSQRGELVTVTGKEPGYRSDLRTDKSLWISRKPDQRLDDKYDIVHIPGCARRAQFLVRWDDQRNQFLLTNEKALDVIEINGELIEPQGEKWLNDGDVIDIYAHGVYDKLRAAGELHYESAYVRIRFQTKR